MRYSKIFSVEDFGGEEKGEKKRKGEEMWANAEGEELGGEEEGEMAS